jgi:1-acyl-sn-glycerol-3-phosphate acyltransferase
MFAARSEAGVFDYLTSQIPALADRLGLSPADLQELFQVFMRSYHVCAARIEEDADKGLVDAIVESRDLIEHLARLLMNADSTLYGAENFARALAFREQGGNVLIVQNHTSGADILATHALLSKDFPGVPAQFIWMAGHVVTKYLLPMLLAAGATRVQIFSVKYRSMAQGQDAQWMEAQNRRAIRALMQRTSKGGQFVVLYPEGGRGERGLIPGVANTMAIPAILDRCHLGAMVLPTFVWGATSILPVVRGEDEFSRFMEYVDRGSAHVRVGEPVYWSEIVARHGEDKQAQVDEVMRLIAALSPSEDLKGVYGNNMEVTA